MATPTKATFRGNDCDFPSQKDAYIWLVIQFFEAYPHLLQNKFITQGPGVNYFALSPQELSPNIAQQAHNYDRITLSFGSWVVNVKLDNAQKHQILSNMGKETGLVEGRNWSWYNSGKKNRNMKMREAAARVQP